MILRPLIGANLMRKEEFLMYDVSIGKLVYTNEQCQGCNRCISVCPVLTANYSIQSKKGSRIEVHSENCISCGACFDVCEHNARSFYDDTERFFADLENGEPISVLIAPAFQANYPEEYSAVLGGLKAMGVNRIISVSAGADITTWGYINHIKKTGMVGGISQPCPAVVNYIEHYAPELIEKLFPVHSPLLCTAIYARKYMHIPDKLAFISPCIAKKTEITDPNTHGYVSYNLTFSHFMNYVRSHNVYGDPASDEVEYGLGSVYPMPGGLSENVYWFCGIDVLLRQVEGEKRAYDFLDDYKNRVKSGKQLPFMVDILNCEKGCIYGTGIEEEKNRSEDNFYNLSTIRENVRNRSTEGPFAAGLTPDERLARLNELFSELDPEDFVRRYTDKSVTVSTHTPSSEDLINIFKLMGKDTDEKRRINCGACGYDNCRSMATAIFNASNIPENCVHFMKDEIHKFSLQLEEQNRNIRQKNEALKKAIMDERASEILIDQIIHALAKSIDLKDQYTRGHSTRVAAYSRKIAEQLGFDEKETETLYRTALLHDIGKLVVPKSILNKPGKLTDDEFAQIKMHSQHGYDILKEIDTFPELAIGAGYHHERIDGKGYPNNKTADEIPYFAKIIAVADTFDAMNSTRPYRKKLEMSEIIGEMKRVSGTQLDSNIVDALINLINEGKIEEQEEL